MNTDKPADDLVRQKFEEKTYDYHEGKFDRALSGDYLLAEVQDNWVMFLSGYQAAALPITELEAENKRLKDSLYSAREMLGLCAQALQGKGGAG